MTKTERFKIEDSIQELDEALKMVPANSDAATIIYHVSRTLSNLIEEFDYYLMRLKKGEKENA